MALTGQVPAYWHAAGFHGFNCNLELISQSKIDGANWQTAEFREAIGNGADQGKGDGDPEGRDDGDREGTVCAYQGTAYSILSLPSRHAASYGVPVIDMTIS